MMFRRIHSVLLLATFAAAFAACGGSDPATPSDAAAGGAGGGSTGGTGGTGTGGTTSPDGSVGDAMTLDPDAQQALQNCTAKANGTDCGGGSICVQGACVSSRCGDGYVDRATNEDCEDGNAAAGDGCNSCRFECRADGDCDDKNVCNGSETCDKTPGKQLCKAGTAPAAGTACMADGMAGVCSNGACAKAGCGNKTMDAGEECDDGNNVDTDGCTRQCKFTCKANPDCDDGNKCNGAETCDVATHTCKAGTAVTCMGMGGCAGTCAPSTGTCTYPDVDKDGKACDTDCNDADPAVFPGGDECKDGKDNDCNPATADGTAASCECFVDTDKDGYAVTATGAVTSGGACPDGYTRRRPDNMTSIDCGPRTAAANPGQRDYFPTSYCVSGQLIRLPSGATLCYGGTSFDYNCDKEEQQQDTRTAAATCAISTTYPILCILRSGWVGAVPACGAKGIYRQCTYANGTCTGTDTPDRIQECR